MHSRYQMQQDNRASNNPRLQLIQLSMEYGQDYSREENDYENQVAETARWETHSSQKQIEIDDSGIDRYNPITDHLPTDLSLKPKINQFETENSPQGYMGKKGVGNLKEKGSKTEASFSAIDHYTDANSSNILGRLQQSRQIQEDNEFIDAKKGEEPPGEVEQKESNEVLGQKQNQFNMLGFQLKECSTCGRKFMESRLQKHYKICSKIKNKREVFNSKLKRSDIAVEETNLDAKIDRQLSRLAGQEHSKISLSPLVDKTSSLPEQCRSTAATNKRSNWKITHQNFLKSIRSCKINPNDPHGKSYHVPLENPDYVFCRFCERRFAPNVAQIHIPKCQHIFHRPKPPTQKKANFLKVLNSLDKKQSKKLVDTDVSMGIIRHRKLEPLEIMPKQSHLKSIQVAPISKQKSSIYEQTQTFTGLLKNYQNVEIRSSNYSNKQCPFCNRKFADKAAERHIPICEGLTKKNGPSKELREAKRSESSSKLQLNLPGCCRHCSFKFSRGHKYCCNCGKKRGE